MLKRLAFPLLIILVGVAVWWANRPAPSASTTTQLQVAAASANAGFARAFDPVPLTFPRDHGPHYDFQTEWWYYTGNLVDEAGQRYGFQLTFFRRGLTPGLPANRDSALATNQIYFAHFAISDVANQQHRGVERFSRGAAGLAGGQSSDTGFSVWLEDWRVDSLTPDGLTQRLRAREGDMALDVVVRATKPAVLHGDNGLSPKSAEPGNASYYVSYTRMATEGTLTVNGRTLTVTGNTWFDQEWSTSALGAGAVGWDWFALQLSDGSELKYFQIRREDGSLEPVSSGTLIHPDGTWERLALSDTQLQSRQTWTSPRTGATYPVAWSLSIPRLALTLDVRAQFPAQEMPLTFHYWEGTVAATGERNGQPLTGLGYLEMTGYSGSMQGVF